MKLSITPESTIDEVAASFRTAYPFLDLKFYKKEHDSHEGSPADSEITKDAKLSSLGDVSKVQDIELAPELTVDQVEKFFEEQMGLHVQVFRKSGDQWLQTSATDHWSLEKQNRIAKESEEADA